MRTKTFVWLALCFITALSVGLMILAIFFYEYDQFDKSNDFEDDSVKMIKKSENAFILFYSLEDPNFGFQNSWQSFRMKIQDWNNTNIVYVGKIECSVFRSTCLSFKVDRYPTIAWIKNGKVVEEYVGDDISESIKKFFDKLVLIVTEQKTTAAQKVTSSVKTTLSPKILQGGSMDIIRRFIEGEREKDSTTSIKSTEVTTTEKYEKFNSTMESSKQDSSNSSITKELESIQTTEKTMDFTKVLNTSNEQIVVTTSEIISTTEKVIIPANTTENAHENSTETTSENPKIPDETFTSSLPIINSSTVEFENQTESTTVAYQSNLENSTFSYNTTTVDESSSESIVMTRPTDTQSSEQEGSKENEESQKNESDEDESAEDDDPFGLKGLFGNANDSKAEYEGESNENKEAEDGKKSEDTSKDQEEQEETEEEKRRNESVQKIVKEIKTTKAVSQSKEYTTKSAKLSSVREGQKDFKIKTESTTKSLKKESTTKKSPYSDEKLASKDKPETTKYESHEKDRKDSENHEKKKQESTTKRSRNNEEKEKFVKKSKAEKSKPLSKEHGRHRKSSK